MIAQIHSLLSFGSGRETQIIPLLTADEIFQAEQVVISSTTPKKNLYISHYSLPRTSEAQESKTPASGIQRHLLGKLEEKISRDHINAYVIADNSRTSSPEDVEKLRNEGTIQHLHESGVNILSYPSKVVLINHTKFMANDHAAVVTSANLSTHSADAPDDNTGFLFTGPAVHNGIVHAFLPQWNFSVSQDKRGWAANYPLLQVDPNPCHDEKVVWINTAPKEETGDRQDQTEIFNAYRNLIHKAASGPPGASFYFAHFDFSNLQLLHHLLYAWQVNPTLDLRLLLDPNQYLDGIKAGPFDTRVIAFCQAKQAGIPLRFARVLPHPQGSSQPQRFHDKFAVYKDQEVINGSGNFSNHSLNGNATRPHNREVDVVVRDTPTAQVFKEKFLNDWIYHSFDDPVIAGGKGFDPELDNYRTLWHTKKVAEAPETAGTLMPNGSG